MKTETRWPSNSGSLTNLKPGTYFCTSRIMSWMDCVMAASSGLPSTRQCTVSRMISGGSAGVMMMMALPCLAPPTFSTPPPAAFPAGPRRGARDLVDVLARARADRAAGDGGHDLAVDHGLHAADGVDHGNRGLAAAGDHVDVHLAPADVLLQVHRWHAVGADGRGREVDHHRALGVDLGAVLGVHVGAGGVEDDLHAVGLHVRDQAVHAFGGGFDAHLTGTFQTIGCRIDTHHPYRLQHGAALQLGQQVGADVARTDQGAFDFFHGNSFIHSSVMRASRITLAQRSFSARM